MQKYSDLGDDQLITLVAHGEKEALEALYDRYGAAVFSMARYMLGDGQLAEEVTQEIYVKVWLKAGSYDSRRGRVRTWLMSIAHNRSVDEIRSRKRDSQATESVPHELLDLHASQRLSTEEEVHRSLSREEVIAALATLPMEQRKVIVMAYFEGYSQSEIAQRLGQPLGTVKTRTRLGMQKLRAVLKYHDGDEK